MSKQNLSERVSRIEEKVETLETQFQERYKKDLLARRMLNTEEAAVFLGMSVDSLRGLTSKKLIPFYKPNNKNIFFEPDELVAWQKKHHFEPIQDI